MLVLGNHVCEYSSSNGDCTNMEAYIPASLVGSISMHVSQSVLHTSNRCDCCHHKQGMYTTTPKTHFTSFIHHPSNFSIIASYTRLGQFLNGNLHSHISNSLQFALKDPTPFSTHLTMSMSSAVAVADLEQLAIIPMIFSNGQYTNIFTSVCNFHNNICCAFLGHFTMFMPNSRQCLD